MHAICQFNSYSAIKNVLFNTIAKRISKLERDFFLVMVLNTFHNFRESTLSHQIPLQNTLRKPVIVEGSCVFLLVPNMMYNAQTGRLLPYEESQSRSALGPHQEWTALISSPLISHVKDDDFSGFWDAVPSEPPGSWSSASCSSDTSNTLMCAENMGRLTGRV